MTQWIFRSTTCACKTPEPSRAKGEEKSPAEVEKQNELQQLLKFPEISVDPRYFPVERYTALKEVGTGAAGTVYLCHDRMLKKPVAVKTLRKLTAEQFISFQKEAKATSKLNHIAIPKLLDFGPTESETPYMVLEYFDGITLEEYINRIGRFDLFLFFRVFENVVSALAHAHTMGIFHRDLKPSNILVARTDTDKPEVRLIDFGVAQVKQDTQEGKTIDVTPLYMPPDVVLGRQYDARSEIYSLGCTMFESLAGAPPFSAKPRAETVDSHARLKPHSLKEASGIEFPEQVEQLIAKCLEKQPEHRFASMEELYSELKQVEGEPYIEPLADNGHQGIPRRGAKIVACIILLVGFGGIAIALWACQSNATKPPEASRKESEGTASTTRSDDAIMSRNSEAETLFAISEKMTRLKESDPATFSDTKGDAKFPSSDSGNELAVRKIGGTSGNTRSDIELGYAYLQGKSVKQDYTAALKWFTKAASHGDSDAALQIGHFYRRGLGVSKDLLKASYWYKRAAAAGNNEGRQNLAEVDDAIDTLKSLPETMLKF